MIASPITSGLHGNEIRVHRAAGGAGESHPKSTPRFSEDLSSVPSMWGYNPSSSLIHTYISNKTNFL